jgi:probable HAF family extracellular repeat protein
MRKLFSIVFSAVLLLIVSGQGTWAQHVKVYDLGHYPGGTWAEMHAINDLGVAVGIGDVPPSGYTHQIGVPLFGPHAGQWFDLGTFGGEDTTGWIWEGGGITDTGMIVGSAGTKEGTTRAFVWTPTLGAKVDLGTLPGDAGSAAIAVNELGTLVVGLSYNELVEGTPVVWTPEVVWKQGRPTTAWKIHKLPKGGLEQPGQVWEGVTLIYWGAWGVNDRGQIIGDAWNCCGAELAVIWNPIQDGKGWGIQQLPHQSSLPIVVDHKYTEALAINNQGDIVGNVNVGDDWSTSPPAFWKLETPGAHRWKLIELTTLSGTPEGWNWALDINDLGDIVGASNDADGNWLATRWMTRDPSTAKVLGFPGDGSDAFGVNNLGIAVGMYTIGNNPERAVAVKFR